MNGSTFDWSMNHEMKDVVEALFNDKRSANKQITDKRRE